MTLYPPNDADRAAARFWIGMNQITLGDLANSEINDLAESLTRFLAAYRAGVTDQLREQLAEEKPGP